MTTADPGSLNADSEVMITYKDQCRINKFARCNARYTDIKDELKAKEVELQNLQDAEDEMMIALDADEKVPFMIGEVFVMKTQEEVTEALEEKRKSLEDVKNTLSVKASELQDTMAQLKVDLYGTFGNNINLEEDEAA